MRLTLVGHASVLLEAGGVRLLSDPWLVGRAFNDGWAPHPAPAWTPDDVDATHLWISHEHPDHLSVPTLKAIPSDRRAAMTVLFQRSWSAEVVDFLHGLGFREVVELDHGREVALPDGVRVTCWQVGHQDSALLVRHGGRTVLNLNDCKPGPAGLRVLRGVTGPVDVLLDQFSIAGWAGNPDDEAALAAARRGALDVLVDHARALRPRAVVPFASFMRFCHEENAWLNRAAVGLDDVAARWDAEVGLPPLALLLNGDAWEPGTRVPEAAPVLDRWATIRDAEVELASSQPRTLEEVRAALDERMADWRRTFGEPTLRAASSAVRFHLTDLGEEVVVDPLGTDRAPTTTLHLSSQAAWFAGAFRFGIETLLISGRFRLEGDPAGWRRMKRLGGAYAAGLTPHALARIGTSPRVRRVVAARGRALVAGLRGA